MAGGSDTVVKGFALVVTAVPQIMPQRAAHEVQQWVLSPQFSMETSPEELQGPPSRMCAGDTKHSGALHKYRTPSCMHWPPLAPHLQSGREAAERLVRGRQPLPCGGVISARPQHTLKRRHRARHVASRQRVECTTAHRPGRCRLAGCDVRRQGRRLVGQATSFQQLTQRVACKGQSRVKSQFIFRIIGKGAEMKCKRVVRDDSHVTRHVQYPCQVRCYYVRNRNMPACLQQLFRSGLAPDRQPWLCTHLRRPAAGPAPAPAGSTAAPSPRRPPRRGSSRPAARRRAAARAPAPQPPPASGNGHSAAAPATRRRAPCTLHESCLRDFHAEHTTEGEQTLFGQRSAPAQDLTSSAASVHCGSCVAVCVHRCATANRTHHLAAQ